MALTTLQAYLLRQSLLYLLVCLFACVGIYLLIDVFERLDKFLENQAGLQTIISYFLIKVPLIVSQILPAAVFLALLLQFGLMQKSREIIAIETGGVYFTKIICIFIFYGLIFSFIHLGFSQLLGVQASKISENIYDNLDQEKAVRKRVISDIWFRSNNYLVHAQRVYPKEKQGSGLKVYKTWPEFKKIEKIFYAEKFKIDKDKWVLKNVEVYETKNFSYQSIASKNLNIQQNLRAFYLLKEKEVAEKVSIFELFSIIKELKKTGSNVERLRTAFHMKIAYSFSILTLVIIGLIIVMKSEKIIANIFLGVVVIFFYYTIYVFGSSLSEKGIVVPWLGAWSANILLGLPAIGVMIFFSKKRDALK